MKIAKEPARKSRVRRIAFWTRLAAKLNQRLMVWALGYHDGQVPGVKPIPGAPMNGHAYLAGTQLACLTGLPIVRDYARAAADADAAKAARKSRYSSTGIQFVEAADYTPGMATGLADEDGHPIHDGDWVSLDGHMTADDSMGLLPNGFLFTDEDRYQVCYDPRIFTWGLKSDADVADPVERKWLNHATSLLHEGKCLRISGKEA